MGVFEVLGDAGGEIGVGGGVWHQVTEMGLLGSAGQNETEVTFVSSYTDTPDVRA
jgi:hypothetical protein